MLRRHFQTLLAGIAGAALLGAGSFASAAVLYSENFDPPGKTFPANNGDISEATVTDDGTGNGILSINDDFDGTGTSDSDKGYFSAAQTFDSPVMTFSFDIVASVTETTGFQNDLIFRAGTGDSPGMLTSSEDVLELILYRDGNRTGYSNTGHESAYIVANNSTSSLDFASPVDASTVSLAPQEYAAYVRDNVAGTFTQAKGPTAFDDTALSMTRFAIGNSSNKYEGTEAIDNVGVVDQVSFATVVPEPVSFSLLGAIGALALGKRRRRP